jgi:cell division protein ZapA (FtsZ GTPase activity inhibitor)
MEKREIRIEILGRQFPIWVTDETEGRAREAAKRVNDRVAHYGSKHSIPDDIFLTLMVALDLAHANIELEENLRLTEQGWQHEVCNLYLELKEALGETA